MAGIGIVAFSERGSRLGASLLHSLKELGHVPEGYAPEKYCSGEMKAFVGLNNITGMLFSKEDLIIFIGACGIAVRAIAPYIAHKMKDPGVLVIDERGRYVISLLSGHVGRANAFARRVAEILGAEPVITTATDVEGLFAVDEWAVENHLRILEPACVKEISSRILAGEKVGFYSELPFEGELPGELTECDTGTDMIAEKIRAGISVSYDRDKKYFPVTCSLLPMDLVVGMGCRRGKSFEELDGFLRRVFGEYGLETGRIGLLCSVDAKAGEEGLLNLAGSFGVRLQTFTPAELSRAEGSFASSSFVKRQTGVDNVCERSASLGSGGGRRLIARQARDGMTLAVCVREMKLRFPAKK